MPRKKSLTALAHPGRLSRKHHFAFAGALPDAKVIAFGGGRPVAAYRYYDAISWLHNAMYIYPTFDPIT